MDDKKIIFALDIGTRSVVGIVGAIKDGCFSILDYEQEFHEKRAMRDGQIEDIDLVAKVVNSVKNKLQERSGQTFTKVSIAAAGRALKTISASFCHDLIPNEPITEKLVQYMEYSAIEKAQQSFLNQSDTLESNSKDYYCVGYSVTDYSLDNYKIKNLEGQKGSKAKTNIIAAFLPTSVLISLYAVTARCCLEVDNLTLEPIAAIHAVVPEDVRFLNIALVDIGGGTSDIAISRDGSVIAYDMVTIAGDEITEGLMRTYLTNFATAEKIKLALNGDENIDFKDILGNEVTITPDEGFNSVTDTIHALADAISQRILLLNGTAPAAVFLVGGGSQIRGLCEILADKLGMPTNRVAIGVANTDNNLSLFSESLYSPTFVTPIGIGIVSSLYRGCDFFAISVNGKRVMLFNHQTIKVIDALMLSGIKPSSLIGLSAPNLIYTLNGEKKTIKGSHGVPGEILVNGALANIETEIKQGDDITVTLAKNGVVPSLTLKQVLEQFNPRHIESLYVNDSIINHLDDSILTSHKVSYMDNIIVNINPLADLECVNSNAIDSSNNSNSIDNSNNSNNPSSSIELNFVSNEASDSVPEKDEQAHHASSKVQINKIYSHEPESSSISLFLSEDVPESKSQDIEVQSADVEIQSNNKLSIDVILNGRPLNLVQETAEPLIMMHLLKYVDLDMTQPKGDLIITLNGVDANYADPIRSHDVAIIKWSEE
ncbi:MAG: cell division protein FtsA [Aminipila sp.]